jgi:hypothetical protein
MELWKTEVQDFKGKPYRLTKFAMGLNRMPAID